MCSAGCVCVVMCCVMPVGVTYCRYLAGDEYEDLWVVDSATFKHEIYLLDPIADCFGCLQRGT